MKPLEIFFSSLEQCQKYIDSIDYIEDLKSLGDNVLLDWIGPGWYFVDTYSQKFSCGCCSKEIVEIYSAQVELEECKKQIQELTKKFNHFLSLVRQSPYSQVK